MQLSRIAWISHYARVSPIEHPSRCWSDCRTTLRPREVIDSQTWPASMLFLGTFAYLSDWRLQHLLIYKYILLWWHIKGTFKNTTNSHSHSRTHTHTHTYAHAQAHAHAHAHTQTHAHTHARAHTHTNARTRIHTCARTQWQSLSTRFVSLLFISCS